MLGGLKSVIKIGKILLNILQIIFKYFIGKMLYKNMIYLYNKIKKFSKHN